MALKFVLFFVKNFFFFLLFTSVVMDVGEIAPIFHERNVA